MIELYSKKSENILKYLTIFEGLGFNKIQALFRKKDIKVNGKHVNENFVLNCGDLIQIYCKNDYFFNIKTIFEDENIIIVFKPKKLEVISETKNISLINLINPAFFAVHRIDFNTEGLVVFAKNLDVKNELNNAFKNSLIQKFYITICKNIPSKKDIVFEDYLVKNNGYVKIFKQNVPNSKKVITKIKVLKTKSSQNANKEHFSLVEVNLLTGRTHQIRSHLAFHGLPVLGDEKYGNFEINKKYNLKNQVLRCFKLKFCEFSGKLSYLNEKVFEISTSDILNMFEKL